jgi:hypothetical protein
MKQQGFLYSSIYLFFAISTLANIDFNDPLSISNIENAVHLAREQSHDARLISVLGKRMEISSSSEYPCSWYAWSYIFVSLHDESLIISAFREIPREHSCVVEAHVAKEKANFANWSPPSGSLDLLVGTTFYTFQEANRALLEQIPDGAKVYRKTIFIDSNAPKDLIVEFRYQINSEREHVFFNLMKKRQ